jgi:hypothetical protein
MRSDLSEKINACLSRAADLHVRAAVTGDPITRAMLEGFATQWIEIAEGYELVADSANCLSNFGPRRAAAHDAGIPHSQSSAR